jgi:hypothetical protein|tara:strand:+ start:73 stop:183 length:111 start_codon:yes stop_codon:yes gene_type:complete
MEEIIQLLLVVEVQELQLQQVLMILDLEEVIQFFQQ